MAKVLCNFRLSEEAIAILDRWAKLTGASRTGGLESLIRRFERLDGFGGGYDKAEWVNEDGSRPQEVRQKRQPSVVAPEQTLAVLNSGAKAEPMSQSRAMRISTLSGIAVRPHTVHSGVSPIEGCPDCAALGKTRS